MPIVPVPLGPKPLLLAEEIEFWTQQICAGLGASPELLYSQADVEATQALHERYQQLDEASASGDYRFWGVG